MSKHFLPFEVNALSTTYQNIAFPLGALQGCRFDYDLFLCDRMINCVARTDGTFDFLDKDRWWHESGLTKEHCEYFLPAASRNECIDINKDMLNNGWYVHGAYNEFFVPGKAAYQNYDFIHDYIIFGYDDKKACFQSAGYLKNGRYCAFDITYDDYYRSIINHRFGRSVIIYDHFDGHFVFTPSVAQIQSELSAYLASSNHTSPLNKGEFYGIQAWKKLSLQFAKAAGQARFIDIRAPRIYMEHKRLMNRRIYTLSAIYHTLPKSASFMEYYEKIYKPTERVFLLALKYNLRPKESTLLQAHEMIDTINAQEIIMLNSLLEALEILHS